MISCFFLPSEGGVAARTPGAVVIATVNANSRCPSSDILSFQGPGKALHQGTPKAGVVHIGWVGWTGIKIII